MSYHQITPDERYMLGALRKQLPPLSIRQMAAIMGRSPSSISREFRRNCSRHDGAYRPSTAQERTNGRRSRTRHWSKLTAQQWMAVEKLLREKHSPEQISGRLREDGILQVSCETIYQYIWADKHAGGQLFRDLRQPIKRRKRYGTRERRGRVIGKRHISERPPEVESRMNPGDWEIDTVHGSGRDSVVTLVERATGFLLMGKIPNLTTASLNKRVIRLMRDFARKHGPVFRTVTSDNGTEFHGYEEIEKAIGLEVYFATPYHSWERGSNENTNGLIRQYLPKRTSMAGLTQARCNAIAKQLNDRPRKRYHYQTPSERLQQLLT